MTLKVKPLVAAVAQHVYHDNNVEALKPEMWAWESLLQLEKLNILAHLVHTDYSNEVASHGDVINAHLPADFKLTRSDGGNVETQDATLSKVQVKMDQHLVVSFVIKDGEETKSMKNLFDVFLTPAIRTISEGIDQMLAGQVYHFIPNSVGVLGTDAARRSLPDVKALMTKARVPGSGRNGVMTADTEADLTSLDIFVGADKVGDDGTALREGSLGYKFGAQHYTDIAIPSLTGGTAGLTKTVNFVAGYPKGYSGAIVLDTDTAHGAMDIVSIGGVPYTVASGALTSVTLTEPLREALADGDSILQNAQGTIVNSHAINYVKGVEITGIRGVVGEGIRTATGELYTIIGTTSVANTYLLDRPLAVALTAGQKVGVFPDGDYNFYFHRDALALVTRPLAAPAAGTGAASFVADANGVGIRVVITYDGLAQGHRVTIDLLAGTKVLNEDLGAVLLT